MKQLKRLLRFTGMVMGSSILAAAQSHETTPKSESIDTLKIRVSFEARGAYDFNKHYKESGFNTATIPMKNTSDSKRLLFDIPSAELSIEKELSISQDEAVKLALEANLAQTLTLNSLYADFKGFRIGNTTTNFCDSDACGLVGGNSIQVRWKHELYSTLNYTVAIEKAPDFVIYPAVKEEDRAQKDLQPHNEVPTLSANLRYEEAKSWHAQLSGLFGLLEYRNKRDSGNTYVPSWGINIGTAYHLVPKQTTLKLQGVYGQGIGNYMEGLNALTEETNTVYTTGNESSARKTLDAWGAGVSVAHKWMPKLHSEASYRIVSTVDSERNGDAYKCGHTVSCNLFYHPNKQFKVGAQYLLGIRQNVSTDVKNANRIQAIIGFEI